MKVTPDRIKARAEQLKSQGYGIRTGTVRATLELNAGAEWQLKSTGQSEADLKSSNAEPQRKSEQAA